VPLVWRDGAQPVPRHRPRRSVADRRKWCPGDRSVVLAPLLTITSSKIARSGAAATDPSLSHHSRRSCPVEVTDWPAHRHPQPRRSVGADRQESACMIDARWRGSPCRGRKACSHGDQRGMIDPGERWIALVGAQNRTSERSPVRGRDHRLGAPFPTPRAPMPSRRAPGLPNSPVGSPDPSHGSGSGWQNDRIPWLRGRPSPTGGHAGSRRDRHRRVPTQLSGGPDPQSTGRDHRIFALHPREGARTQVREARRASPEAPTGSIVLPPGHRGP
jgi:hypothetical protein